jgi:hypothetical protein
VRQVDKRRKKYKPTSVGSPQTLTKTENMIFEQTRLFLELHMQQDKKT